MRSRHVSRETNSPSSGPLLWLGAAALPAVVASWLLAPAWAQQPAPQIPGLVVSNTPPAAPPPAGPPPTAIPGLVISPPTRAPAPPPGMLVPPPAAPAAPVPQAKPKPKPAAPKVAAPKPAATGPQGIAALVNDEPITAFEVERRSRFMAIGGNFAERAKANLKARAEDPRTTERIKGILEEVIRSNPGKPQAELIRIFEERKKAFVTMLQQEAISSAKASLVPTFRKKALDELIEERLKLQEAKRLTIKVGDEDVERAFKGIAERNKMTPDQFRAFIQQQGADSDVMKERYRVQLAWREVIRRRFGHQINVSNLDVDRLAANVKGDDTLELQLHKITLSVPGKVDQAALAKRYETAEALRGRFGGCKGTAALAKDQPNAKFEDLGFRKSEAVPEPTRTLLISARDGEMVPAVLTASGVELYAVCARRVQKISEEKRQQAEGELQAREFERLAQRHLNDLRKDALIEMR